MFFQTKNNIPEVYINESRDFQLISSALDSIYNYLLSNKSKMDYLDDLELVDAKLLDLIKDYLGFFTDQYYPENLLRSILINFPYMIKNKGSYNGVKIAIEALQNAFTSISYINIIRTGESKDNTSLTGFDNSTFEISTDGVIINQNYIDEVLAYVLPIGALVDRIYIVQAINTLTPESFTSKDDLIILNLQDKTNSNNYLLGSIRKSQTFLGMNNSTEITASNTLEQKYIGKIGQTPIVKQAITKHITINKGN